MSSSLRRSLPVVFVASMTIALLNSRPPMSQVKNVLEAVAYEYSRRSRNKDSGLRMPLTSKNGAGVQEKRNPEQRCPRPQSKHQNMGVTFARKCSKWGIGECHCCGLLERFMARVVYRGEPSLAGVYVSSLQNRHWLCEHGMHWSETALAQRWFCPCP